jgi:hypothetical protein
MSDQAALLKLAAKYTPVPNDLGMFQGPGFTMAAPAPGCPGSMTATFQAGLSAGRVPASLNPSGQLMNSRGNAGLTLESPLSGQCDPGCFGRNPDPRNLRVKPLYVPHSYKLSNAPTASTARGMYN